MAATLKPLNPCGLQIHYLYTAEFQIRFDKTCKERVFVLVTRRKNKEFLFNGVLSTEEARAIYKELKRRGASPEPEEATC